MAARPRLEDSSSTHPWPIVRRLRRELRTATSSQWLMIQEARAWEATGDLIHDWFICRYALPKLEIAGLARFLQRRRR